jgi:NADH-quinone oxidoreductase subunit M
MVRLLAPSGAALASPELPALLLSGMVWIPAIAAIALLFFPQRTEQHRARIRSFALSMTALVVGLGVVMWYGYRDQAGTYAYEESRHWLPGFGASYHLGVDGISMPLLLLAGIVFLTAALASNRIREDLKVYFILLLLLETGVNGVFCSLDFLLFFLFWQMQAIPIFLLIGRFGSVHRRHAAWKFLVFEMVGSAFLLLAILILYVKAPTRTLDVATLHDLQIPASVAGLVFSLFFAAFVIRMPVFPLHAWFTEAMQESASPLAILLSGIVVTVGAYGLYRVNVGQFQGTLHRASGAVTVLAVVTVLWSAVAAFREDDLRRLIGYVVVSHMGVVLLAVVSASPVALNGGILLLVADGLTAAMLILLVNAVGERANTRSIRALGGLAARMPRGAVLWMLAALAALGLPGLAGFVGQFMIVLGAYPSHRLATSLVIVGGMLVAAVMLWTVQRIFFGPISETYTRVRDLSTLELGTGVGLLCLLVLLGVLPAILMDSINFSILTLLSRGGG